MKREKVIRSLLSGVFLCTAVWLSGCGEADGTGACDIGKTRVAAGLPPVAYLAKRVGGDAVTVRTMLPEGRSPHDFSPGPREVRDAAGSRLFLVSGMRFESALTRPLDRGKVRVSDVSRGIERIPMEVSCTDHDHDHEHKHDGDTLDPHVWLDAENACRMAENIRDDLSELDPVNAEKYRRNCRELTEDLRRRAAAIRERLLPYRGRCFYVYHPAFGYFARMTGLRQEAIELGGREVTPSRLAQIIRQARRDDVKVVFVQPQFSPSGSRALARELGAEVMPADPLREDLAANFDYLADALARGFSGGAEVGGDSSN